MLLFLSMPSNLADLSAQETSEPSHSNTSSLLGDDQLFEIYRRSPPEIKLSILRLRPNLIKHSAIELDEFITSIKPGVDLQQEAIYAGVNNKEPPYIKTISKLLEIKVRKFSERKLQQVYTPEELLLHSYNLLFTMAAYNSSSKFLADDAAFEVGQDVAEQAGKVVALHFAEELARNAVEKISWSIARSVSWNIEKFFINKDAKATVLNASYLAFHESKRKSIRSEGTLGRIVYRVAEKTSLLYFLKNFDSIVERSYQVCLAKINKYRLNLNWYTSRKEWFKYRRNNFYFEEEVSWYWPYFQVKKGSKYYLTPWFKELDRLAIENDDFP